MLLAERSGKAAVEDQQDVGLALEISKADRLTQEIPQGEIGGGGIKRNLGHGYPPEVWMIL
jgi:hypothetical protein